MVHLPDDFNPSTGEMEAGGSLRLQSSRSKEQVQGQLRLHRKMSSQKTKIFFFFGDFISFIEKLKSWVHQNQFLGEGKKTELIIEKKVTIIWATTEPREYILIIEKF